MINSASNQLQQTIDYYQSNSETFWENTRDHDVNQNYAAFQTKLPALTNMTILDFGCGPGRDFGCGPGRDLKYFKVRGHNAIGLDACENFCRMAESYSGCKVLKQNFCDLKLPSNYFNGIFANASIFHIPKSHLPAVLKKLYNSLKDDGILFSSNPRGDGEKFEGNRYGNYMEFPEYSAILEKAGFTVLDHYYRPTGWVREEQTWLAVVSKKNKPLSMT